MARTKLREMLDLATELQATSVGLTIQDMMAHTERSRRTVERMLTDLKELGLEAEAKSMDFDHHLTKRWSIKKSLPSPLLDLRDMERSTLETLLNSLPSGTERQALSKLLAAAHRPAGTLVAVDQEDLIERTAHLGRVGPRSAVDETLVIALENAIRDFKEIDIAYKSPRKGKASTRRVQPLGMLFGRFGYLVANTGNRGVLTYRMDLIEDAQPTHDGFEYPRGFNMKEYSAESFGIYHGDELLTVKLRFNASVADRAKTVRFHSSQTEKRLSDGSLQVILRCRGHQELFWELCHPDWAGNVQIVGPDELIEEYLIFVDKLK